MKQCGKCKRLLDDFCFNKRTKGSKDGLGSICKDCQREYDAARSEQRKEYRKKYAEEHKEYFKKYEEEHKEQRKAYLKEYTSTEEYKKKKAEYDKVYREKNRELINEKGRQRYKEIGKRVLTEEQKQAKREYMNNYRDKNREEINKKKREKNAQDSNYRLNHVMSSAIYRVLRNIKSDRHWEDLLNYSIEDLKHHLESQFTPEMNWDNMGQYWEIDHIIPLNMFNYKSEEDKEFKICWSLMNLRPLEKIENKSRPKDGRDIPKEQAISILGLELYNDILSVEN